VPIYDLAIANEALADMAIDEYYSCCVEGAFTPSGNLKIVKRVRFAIPTETKQMKKRLRK
jgi:hypothetical protein